MAIHLFNTEVSLHSTSFSVLPKTLTGQQTLAEWEHQVRTAFVAFVFSQSLYEAYEALRVVPLSPADFGWEQWQLPEITPDGWHSVTAAPLPKLPRPLADMLAQLESGRLSSAHKKILDTHLVGAHLPTAPTSLVIYGMRSEAREPRLAALRFLLGQGISLAVFQVQQHWGPTYGDPNPIVLWDNPIMYDWLDFIDIQVQVRESIQQESCEFLGYAAQPINLAEVISHDPRYFTRPANPGVPRKSLWQRLFR